VRTEQVSYGSEQEAELEEYLPHEQAQPEYDS
jgi:hypothetical protein